MTSSCLLFAIDRLSGPVSVLKGGGEIYSLNLLFFFYSHFPSECFQKSELDGLFNWLGYYQDGVPKARNKGLIWVPFLSAGLFTECGYLKQTL